VSASVVMKFTLSKYEGEPVKEELQRCEVCKEMCMIPVDVLPYPVCDDCYWLLARKVQQEAEMESYG